MHWFSVALQFFDRLLFALGYRDGIFRRTVKWIFQLISQSDYLRFTYNLLHNNLIPAHDLRIMHYFATLCYKSYVLVFCNTQLEVSISELIKFWRNYVRERFVAGHCFAADATRRLPVALARDRINAIATAAV